MCEGRYRITAVPRTRGRKGGGRGREEGKVGGREGGKVEGEEVKEEGREGRIIGEEGSKRARAGGRKRGEGGKADEREGGSGTVNMNTLPARKRGEGGRKRRREGGGTVNMNTLPASFASLICQLSSKFMSIRTSRVEYSRGKIGYNKTMQFVRVSGHEHWH